MDKQQDIDRAKEAVNNGKVDYIRFYHDGSGFETYFTDPTGDHGMPCLRKTSFSMDAAPAVLAGGTFDQHHWKY